MIFTTENGVSFNVSEAQAETLNQLTAARAGGIAKVYGYVATSGRTSPTVYDAQLITRFSMENLYLRRKEALEGITFDVVWPLVQASKDEKLSSLSEEAAELIFDQRKGMQLDSINKSLSIWNGETSADGDARREAHQRVYVEVVPGVKVHLVTETMGKIKQPIIETNGYPIADTINLTVLELSRNVIEPGEYKTVNSSAPVLMGKLIEKLLNSRSTQLKQLSLAEGKFDRLVLDRVSYLPEDVSGIDSSILNG